jgi:hypothetical protein
MATVFLIVSESAAAPKGVFTTLAAAMGYAALRGLAEYQIFETELDKPESMKCVATSTLDADEEAPDLAPVLDEARCKARSRSKISWSTGPRGPTSTTSSRTTLRPIAT